MDSLGNKEAKKMRDWLLSQVEHFNVLTIIVMVLFVSIMSRANLTKQLKQQSEEVYKWHEEIKQEIWRAKE